MIKVIKHSNFGEWVKLFKGDELIEEYQNKRKAWREAYKLAKAAGHSVFYYLDECEKVA